MPTGRSVFTVFSHRAVAQLVEQRSPKPQVGGSSPPALLSNTMGRWHSGNTTGSSAAWYAPALGAGCRGFKSRLPDLVFLPRVVAQLG